MILFLELELGFAQMQNEKLLTLRLHDKVVGRGSDSRDCIGTVVEVLNENTGNPRYKVHYDNGNIIWETGKSVSMVVSELNNGNMAGGVKNIRMLESTNSFPESSLQSVQLLNLIITRLSEIEKHNPSARLTGIYSELAGLRAVITQEFATLRSALEKVTNAKSVAAVSVFELQRRIAVLSRSLEEEIAKNLKHKEQLKKGKGEKEKPKSLLKRGRPFKKPTQKGLSKDGLVPVNEGDRHNLLGKNGHLGDQEHDVSSEDEILPSKKNRVMLSPSGNRVSSYLSPAANAQHKDDLVESKKELVVQLTDIIEQALLCYTTTHDSLLAKYVSKGENVGFVTGYASGWYKIYCPYTHSNFKMAKEEVEKAVVTNDFVRKVRRKLSTRSLKDFFHIHQRVVGECNPSSKENMGGGKFVKEGIIGLTSTSADESLILGGSRVLSRSSSSASTESNSSAAVPLLSAITSSSGGEGSPGVIDIQLPMPSIVVEGQNNGEWVHPKDAPYGYFVNGNPRKHPRPSNPILQSTVPGKSSSGSGENGMWVSSCVYDAAADKDWPEADSTHDSTVTPVTSVTSVTTKVRLFWYRRGIYAGVTYCVMFTMLLLISQCISQWHVIYTITSTTVHYIVIHSRL